MRPFALSLSQGVHNTALASTVCPNGNGLRVTSLIRQKVHITLIHITLAAINMGVTTQCLGHASFASNTPHTGTWWHIDCKAAAAEKRLGAQACNCCAVSCWRTIGWNGGVKDGAEGGDVVGLGRVGYARK